MTIFVLVPVIVFGSESTLFSNSEPIDIQLTGDLKKLFSDVNLKIKAGEFDQAKTLSVQGTLKLSDAILKRVIEVPVVIKVRGNSSLEECSFPKLKLKLETASIPVGSMLSGLSELAINSHCGELPVEQRTPKNRIANQLSPLREALVYQIFSLVDAPVQKVRIANINYIDFGITRFGLLLENLSVTASRAGGNIQKFQDPYEDGRCIPGDPCAIPQNTFQSAEKSRADLQSLARIYLAEALVGNYDWNVKVAGEETMIPLWNAELVTRKDGSSIVLAEDFDLATVVTGKPELSADILTNGKIDANESLEFNLALVRLHTIKKLFGDQIYQGEILKFSSNKDFLLKLIASSNLDAQGKNQFTTHVNEFYKAVESLNSQNSYVFPEEASGE